MGRGAKVEMIPKFDGSNLMGAKGETLGVIRNRVLTRLIYQDDWGEHITFCSFAIMEFGGLFDRIVLNVLDNGLELEIDTPDIRKTEIHDGEHILNFMKMRAK